jgi:hypothetical protein
MPAWSMPVLRLAEMYLIAAEGYMMAGQSAQAIQKLNELRTALSYRRHVPFI